MHPGDLAGYGPGVFSEKWIRAALEHNADTIAHMAVEWMGWEWAELDEEVQDSALTFGRQVVERLAARIGVDL